MIASGGCLVSKKDMKNTPARLSGVNILYYYSDNSQSVDKMSA